MDTWQTRLRPSPPRRNLASKSFRSGDGEGDGHETAAWSPKNVILPGAGSEGGGRVRPLINFTPGQGKHQTSLRSDAYARPEFAYIADRSCTSEETHASTANREAFVARRSLCYWRERDPRSVKAGRRGRCRREFFLRTLYSDADQDRSSRFLL